MRPRRRASHGSSVVETTVVIVLFGVLLSILMPAIGTMRENALSKRCQDNLNSLRVALNIYMSDYISENWLPASQLPDGPFWFERLEPFVNRDDPSRARDSFVCPRAPRGQRGFTRETISYGWNQKYLPFGTLTSQWTNHNETIAIADTLAGPPPPDTVLSADGQLRLDTRHRARANVLFVGGNIQAMTRQEATFEWPRYWNTD